MQNKMKVFAIAMFVLFLIVPVLFSGVVFSRSNTADSPEAPRLVYPIDPEVKIAGDFLEFKWQHASIGVDHYEFILYKGGGPSGETIVIKKLPFNVSSVQVPASSFEDNQTYT
ncbi:MAG: hypothetical protein WCY05_07050, partial [Candidatus Omnitrophota bacterium]